MVMKIAEVTLQAARRIKTDHNFEWMKIVGKNFTKKGQQHYKISNFVNNKNTISVLKIHRFTYNIYVKSMEIIIIFRRATKWQKSA